MVLRLRYFDVFLIIAIIIIITLLIILISKINSDGVVCLNNPIEYYKNLKNTTCFCMDILYS